MILQQKASFNIQNMDGLQALWFYIQLHIIYLNLFAVFALLNQKKPKSEQKRDSIVIESD